MFMTDYMIFSYLGALIIGLIMGLIGAGGSIMILPILVYLFKLPPVDATFYSLFVVGLTALVGSIYYARKQMVDFKTGILFSIPSFLGVFLTRKYILPTIPDIIFSFGNLVLTKNIFILLFFSLIMLLSSISMIRDKKKTTVKKEQLGVNYSFIILEGLVIGGLTGMVGAGGGFLIIPALVVLTGIPMKEAIGTSLFIISIKSLFGLLGDLGSVKINWQFLGLFSSISILGVILGMYLNKFVSGKKLKKGFGYFTLIMGILIFVKEIFEVKL
jgi:uncharacterized membrane protein YfcA